MFSLPVKIFESNSTSGCSEKFCVSFFETCRTEKLVFELASILIKKFDLRLGWSDN